MYANVKDIKSQFLKIKFGDANSIDEDELKAIILRKSNYIDSRLCFKYVMPVDPDLYKVAYSVVNQICIWLVVYEVEDVLNLGRTVPKSENGGIEKSRGEKLYDKAMMELDRIETGELALAMVPLVGGSANRFYNSNVANQCDPVFKKNERQW